MLDEKDKLILEYLMHDCRITTTKLAKITKLSQPSITYRIKKLEEQKYILKYDVLINPDKFNTQMSFFFVFIPKNKQEEFEKEITNDKKIMSVFKHINKYNYSLTTFTNKKENEQIKRYLEKNNYKYIYYKGIQTRHYPISIFNLNIQKPQINTSKEKLKLDKTDAKILNRLVNGGAKSSILELTKHTNLTTDLVLYRFKKLQKANYFSLYIAQPNLEKFHLQYDVLIIGTQNIEENLVFDKIKKLNKIIFVSQIEQNKYLVTLISQNFEDYKNTLDKLITNLDEKLVNIEQFMIKKILKLNNIDFKKII
jgi:DNA-binding Lrp family transcriptional regulator